MARVNSRVFLSGSQIKDGVKIQSFDQLRGFNPSMSQGVTIRSHCQNEKDLSRLHVLENYKQVNRMIRRNFLNSSDRRGLPLEEVQKLEAEDRSSQDMAQVLAKLQNKYARAPSMP